MAETIKIKTVCSCIRDIKVADELARLAATHRVSRQPAPKEGDLVVVRARDDVGAYTYVENQSGRDVAVHRGDAFIAVLGTRESGTSISGTVPTGPVECGQTLRLLSVGGIVGELKNTPSYMGPSSLAVEVLGFVPRAGGAINLRDLQQVEAVGEEELAEVIAVKRSSMRFVFGTSAECGKTTLMCKAIRALAEEGRRVGAIKAVGTGRLRDGLRCSDAGAEVVKDYVDAGWPSTYNMPDGTFAAMFSSLLVNVARATDFTLVEVGGDLLGGHAEDIVDFAARWNIGIAVCVNDAMGALGCRKILSDHGFEKYLLASLKQNSVALSERLNGQYVHDISSGRELASHLTDRQFTL